MARRELSDDEWELIEPFLPIGRYGPFPQHPREQFEGVIRRFRTGSQWREMAEEFGPGRRSRTASPSGATSAWSPR